MKARKVYYDIRMFESFISALVFCPEKNSNTHLPREADT